MLFKDIVGQTKAKTKLLNAVKENRISHALLFLGPEGCGKLSLAIAYAQFICCENKQDGDSCGVCNSCIKYEKLIHPDLHFVFPVVKNKKKSEKPVSDDFIADWREFVLTNPYFSLNQWFSHIGLDNTQGAIYNEESYEILKKLSFKTFESEYKIMIIWMPEKMNSFASNKLLKLLEEPYEKTLFILVSEDTGQIIQTILSRTQLFKIPKIDDNSLFNYLINREIEAREATNIVKLSDGNVVTALSLINNNSVQNEYLEYFMNMMRLAFARELKLITEWASELSKLGREKIKEFLIYSLRMTRENLILSQNLDKISHMTNEENEFSIKFSKYITFEKAEIINKEINTAIFHIERNGNPNTVLLDLILQILRIIK